MPALQQQSKEIPFVVVYHLERRVPGAGVQQAPPCYYEVKTCDRGLATNEVRRYIQAHSHKWPGWDQLIIERVVSGYVHTIEK